MIDKNEKALISWLAGAQGIINRHYAKNFTNLIPETLQVTEGKRYFRVIKGSSAFAFIDRENGDVLKPASWKTPAKHARGNIFDTSNGLGLIDPYGPVYLR